MADHRTSNFSGFPDRGDGPLFCPPDVDAARLAFRDKPKGLSVKVMSVSEAIERFVQDGDYLGSGGFGGDRIATALLHEIVRQKKQHLGLAGHTATHDFQILAAGNNTGRGRLLKRVDVAYIIGLEARGLSPHARRVSESGDIEFCEWSNYALAVRFKAGAMGVPFLPMRSMAGTDTYKHSAARKVICPFTGIDLVAIPALWPDVSVIHVHEADAFGNCRIRGTSVADFDLARASKRVIISCERLISNDEIRRDPTSTVIPYFCVDAVCEVPYGSYPGNMPYEYYSDEDHLQLWLKSEVDEESYAAFLEHHLFGVSDFTEYLERCGGLRRMQELRHEEFFPNG
ncbi:MAG: CoA transferase subunit A [Planctomycetota bacterium]|nr:CoA transferase subunit A [Planctomycetota bacterium]MDA1211299.1 CoA transferase subunit A [Planctomycetota bacterium]